MVEGDARVNQALHRAMEIGDLDRCRTLLSLNGKVFASDVERAICSGRPDMVELLAEFAGPDLFTPGRAMELLSERATYGLARMLLCMVKTGMDVSGFTQP